MEINQLKKELNLDNKQISEFFDLTPTSFANSTAKHRYEQALCKFYEFFKKHSIKTNLLNYENWKNELNTLEYREKEVDKYLESKGGNSIP